MEGHNWEDAWVAKKFTINTLEPSLLVLRHSDEFFKGARVLDVGCGNGRNSLFLGSKGCFVDCFDVMNMGELTTVPQSVEKFINFKKTDVLGFEYGCEGYDAFVVARVIQYLDKEELSFLFQKIKNHLKPNGFLVLSYTAEGGIFLRKEINVPKFHYPIEVVEENLKQIFNVVKIVEGSNTNKHVNYSEPVITYDIYATGLKQ